MTNTETTTCRAQMRTSSEDSIASLIGSSLFTTAPTSSPPGTNVNWNSSCSRDKLIAILDEALAIVGDHNPTMDCLSAFDDDLLDEDLFNDVLFNPSAGGPPSQ